MKTARIMVCLTPDEKKEVHLWAKTEGRTDSNYLMQLHNDYVRRAKAEGRGAEVDDE